MSHDHARYSEKQSADKLLAASLHGNLREVRRLLLHGVPPDVRDANGDTPLILATGAGNPKVIQELLAAGANLNLRNDEGLTPLTYALRWRNSRIEQVISMLIEGTNMGLADCRGYYPQDFAMMAAFNHWKAPAGIDVDQLHLCVTWAANGGDAKLLSQYLGSHVAIRILTNALVLASIQGFPECCRMLLDMGADVNGYGIFGNRPLVAAACNLRTDVVRLLLEHGAEIDGRDDMLRTPLMRVCEASVLTYEENDNKNFDTIKSGLIATLLLEGADIRAVDESGKTPLHLAEADPSTIVLLLEHGADPFAVDNYGCLPLSDMLVESGKAVVKRCLSECMSEKDVEEALES